MPHPRTMSPCDALQSPSHSTAFTLWEDDFYAFSPRPTDDSGDELISLFASTASEFGSAESLDSRADLPTLVPAPIYTFEAYVADRDVAEPEPEPLTSRYLPEAPATPPRSKRVRKPRVHYSAVDREEKDLRAAIKASLKPTPAVPSSDQASTSRMIPAPVVSAIENVAEKIEVHGRWYTLVEFAQKYCRLRPDPSGKTCKYL